MMRSSSIAVSLQGDSIYRYTHTHTHSYTHTHIRACSKKPSHPTSWAILPTEFCLPASWLLPWWLSKESIRQCRRHRFDPWVGKIPWKKNWQPTPVFLPGKSHGQRGAWWAIVQGIAKESDTTERLNNDKNPGC